VRLQKSAQSAPYNLVIISDQDSQLHCSPPLNVLRVQPRAVT
jgi:hypothetical protein